MTVLPTTNSIEDSKSLNRLSVQVSLTGLSFLLQSESENLDSEQIAFDSELNPGQVLTELINAFDTLEFLKKPIGQVAVIYHNKEFTLVPTKVFNPNNLADYLKYNARLLATDFLDYDAIDNLDITNVFVPYTNVNNFIFDRYGDFIFNHSTTVYLKATSRLLQSELKQTIFIELLERDFILAAYKKDQLQLCNIYAHTSAQDFMYFLLFAIEQLQFDNNGLKLIITGGLDENHPYYELLYTYIRHISTDLQTPDESQFLTSNCWV